MIGAGSGVTPFLSIMREFYKTLGAPGAPQKMSLLASYRSTKDIIGKDLIDEIQKLNNPNLQIHVTLSREDLTSQGFLHGRISKEMLQTLVPTPASLATYMLCGPVEMMHMGKAMLLENNVAEMHVKTEDFAS
jgi:ferredoxin-NADP reductase